MKTITPTAWKTYQARAAIIKAMAHPTRLFILDELTSGERCVCELTAMIGADMSTVSKHLSLLKNAGLIKDERRGTQIFYTLRFPCAKNFFSCVEEVLKGDPAQHAASVESHMKKTAYVHTLKI